MSAKGPRGTAQHTPHSTTETHAHHRQQALTPPKPRARAHRLAEAHLVGEDAVEAVLPEADEPLDALELVVAQLPLDEGQQGLGLGGRVGGPPRRGGALLAGRGAALLGALAGRSLLAGRGLALAALLAGRRLVLLLVLLALLLGDGAAARGRLGVADGRQLLREELSVEAGAVEQLVELLEARLVEDGVLGRRGGRLGVVLLSCLVCVCDVGGFDR